MSTIFICALVLAFLGPIWQITGSFQISQLNNVDRTRINADRLCYLQDSKKSLIRNDTMNGINLFINGGARGVIVIVAGIGHGDSSSMEVPVV